MKDLTTFDLLVELMSIMPEKNILDGLFIHKGTLRRWQKQKKVPNNYFNDINHLLGDKYNSKEDPRDKDQFFTTKQISKYCYGKTLKILEKLDIDYKKYTFIEPSAGCGSFYKILPKNRRIGIDIEPVGELKEELIKTNYLDYEPDINGKYIVIGNPPFGLRGNLALRFINHSYNFADVVAFILPPLFNSTGKGVPMTRIKGYKLAHTEKLPLNSFIYPNGKVVEVSTIFQIWTKISIDKIKTEITKTCNTFIKVYSLSDGGTPSSTRNKNMLGKCDIYLPSTCFKGMKIYSSFDELPNRRGYGIVILKKRSDILDVFYGADWNNIAFISTNSALNLRTDLIKNEIIKRGYYDG